MNPLLRHPTGQRGKVHDITPTSARWSYVGFGLYRLAPGETVAEPTGDTEVILVLVEGKARIGAGDRDFGELGDRLDVFEKTPPHCVYVPARARTGRRRRRPPAPSRSAPPPPPTAAARPRSSAPPASPSSTRGKGANTRHIFPIAMEDRDVADSLLVTEVFTPQGNWSSYPPHRHDEDDFPRMTYLEETYYHRLNPAQGFGFQRVFTEDGSLDETMAVADHDVVLVPKGHHPCAAPYGYDLYYLNVMAGPLPQVALPEPPRPRLDLRARFGDVLRSRPTFA